MKRLKKPREYGLSSKFADYYPGQEEAILSIADQFLSGKRVVLLSAPTGAGKSLLAVGLSKYMEEIHPSFSTVYSVQTKALQDQVSRDFPHFVDMRGRGNFQCAEQSDLSVDEGLCTLPDYVCESKYTVCDYYRQKRRAAAAESVVTSRAFFLAEANYTDGLVSGDRNLHVLDEGHLLEDAIMGFVSVRLPEKSLKAVGISLPRLSGPTDAKSWANEVLPILSEEYSNLNATIGTATRSNGHADVRDIRLLLRYKSMTRRLDTLRNIEPGKWFLSKTYAGYILKPFLVDEFVDPLVVSHSSRTLMMSATFLSSHMMTRLLGLSAKTTGWYEMDSNFPPERRPYNFIPILKLNYKTGSVGYKRLTGAIDEILERHPGEKGIVHTSSFRVMEEILRHTDRPGRFISHRPSSSDDEREFSRDQAIDRFMSTSKPLVLISPSIGLGLDLKDDLCRFNVIAKVPFKSLADKQVKYRLENDPSWYSWCAVADIVQSCGRSMRHRGDYSTSYILDAAFWQLIKRHKAFFPKWWRDALHIVRSKNVEDAVMAKGRKGGG